MLDEWLSISGIQSQDDFRIRLSSERVRVEATADIPKAVDLAVERHRVRCDGRAHRLIAAGEVNDAKPCVAQGAPAWERYPCAIRTTMVKCIPHRLERRGVLLRPASYDAEDSAHPRTA
jgi:hypothetical protein